MPAHWAEARIVGRVRGKRRVVRRFGWSDEGAGAAEAHAQARADAAWAALVAGAAVDGREPKVPYQGADGVPIREEVVERHGRVVISRNAYGARCLNTPDALFFDVDLRPGGPAPWGWVVGVAGCLAGAFAGGALGGSWALPLIGAAAALGAGIHVVQRARAPGFAARAEAAARARVEVAVRRRPGWLLELYRTPRGLRGLAVHAPFDPRGPEAAALFDEIGGDPVYGRMCRAQRCFRARVSPKPWRAGVRAPLRPRPGVWPVRPERLAERTAWVEAYERAVEGFAACRHLATLGDGRRDPRVDAVRELHDRLSRARTPLPLA